MGGGSSEVTPYRRRSVADALSERLPGAVVSSEVGCRIDRGLPAIDLRLLDGEAFGIEYFDRAEPSGAAVATDVAHSARVLWIGPPRPGLVVGECSVRISGTFTPDVSGRWRLGLESAGRSVLRVDGAVVVDNTEPVRGEGFYGAGSQAGRGGVRPRGRAPVRALGGGVAPLGLLPHPRRPDRRGPARRGRRARARRGRGEGRGPGRGRRRVERPVGVRGARPARPVPAGLANASWSRR